MKIKLSKSQWQFIGKKAGWIKKTAYNPLNAPGRNEIGYKGENDIDYRKKQYEVSDLIEKKYKKYKSEFEKRREEKEVELQEVRSKDIKETHDKIAAGIPLDQIETVVAKDIMKHEQIFKDNDYNMRDISDLTEWAKEIDKENFVHDCNIVDSEPMSFEEFENSEKQDIREYGFDEWDIDEISHYFN